MEAEQVEISAIQCSDAVHVRDQRLTEVQNAAAEDEEQKVLQKLVVQGWPDRWKEVPTLGWKYWNFRESLGLQDGILYKGEQIVVLRSLRADYLQRLHTGHMGREPRLRRAKDVVYWPNI